MAHRREGVLCTTYRNGEHTMPALYATLQSFMTDLGARLHKEDEGATAVEYGLMVSLIAVVIIAAVTLIGTSLTTIFNTVAAAL